MEKKKPSSRELARRRKIRKWWAKRKNKAARSAESTKRWNDSDYARKVIEGAKRASTPDVIASRVAKCRETNADPTVKKRRSVGCKKSWTPERRAAQSARMRKLHADPMADARRRAGLARKWSEPEFLAKMDALRKKINADPNVRAGRRARLKKLNADPEVKARRTSTLNNMWAEFRAARLAQAQSAAKPRNLGGRPRKDELWRIAAALNQQGASPRGIAREWDPHFADNPDAAEDRMRKGIKRWQRRHKQEAPVDDPEALHNG